MIQLTIKYSKPTPTTNGSYFKVEYIFTGTDDEINEVETEYKKCYGDGTITIGMDEFAKRGGW